MKNLNYENMNMNQPKWHNTDIDIRQICVFKYNYIVTIIMIAYFHQKSVGDIVVGCDREWWRKMQHRLRQVQGNYLKISYNSFWSE